MQIINGREIAEEIREELKSDIKKLKVKPCIVVILVGDDPASVSYVTGKHKACEEIGIKSLVVKEKADIKEEELLKIVDKYNKDSSVHGILVQLPLPKHIDQEKVIERISPEKDVDGFHPINLGKMVRGLTCFLPATPAGIKELLIRSGNLPEGKNVVIVGRSNLVGKPIANILMGKGKGENATVTVVHSGTKDLQKFTKEADILIVAIGKPQFITKDMVKKGAVVIDVGVNRVEDKTKKNGFRLIGDVDYEGVLGFVKAITPVPGGVGPMTITMLLKNTVEATKYINK